MIITITRAKLVNTALVAVLIALGIAWRRDVRERKEREQAAREQAARDARPAAATKAAPEAVPPGPALPAGRVLTPATLPTFVAVCRSGDAAAVTKLLEGGARPDQTDEQGRTALHHAVSVGAGEVVQALLAHAADPDLGNERWAPPLALAAFNGNEELVGLLLAAGAHVDQPDRSAGGRTALILAAERGHREVVVQLLAAGARVDAQDASQATALHRAAEEGAVEVGELLVAHGAPLEAKDAEGATPLARAKGAMKARFAALLLARGAHDAAPVPDEAADLRVQPAPPEDEATGMGRSSIELAPEQRSWDGPLLPGNVMSVPCETPADWSKVPRAKTGGFSPGDEAVALTADGKAIPVRLGEVSVRRIQGWRGCWASIGLEGLPRGAQVEFVAPPGFLEPDSKLFVPTYRKVELATCGTPPVWKLRWPDRRTCWTVGVGWGDQVILYSFRQESSKTEWVFARPETPANAPWTYVGRFNGTTLGVSLSVKDRHGTRLLWRRSDHEPNRVTELVTLMGPNGSATGRALMVEGPSAPSRQPAPSRPAPAAKAVGAAEEFTRMPAIRVEPLPAGGWTTRTYHLIKSALAGSPRHKATWWLGGSCLVGASSIPFGEGREAIAVATIDGRGCDAVHDSSSSFFALLDVSGPAPAEISRTSIGWGGLDLARLELGTVAGLVAGDQLLQVTWLKGPSNGRYLQLTMLERYQDDTWRSILELTGGATAPPEAEPVLTRLEVVKPGLMGAPDLVAIPPSPEGDKGPAPRRRNFYFQAAGYYRER